MTDLGSIALYAAVIFCLIVAFGGLAYVFYTIGVWPLSIFFIIILIVIAAILSSDSTSSMG